MCGVGAGKHLLAVTDTFGTTKLALGDKAACGKSYHVRSGDFSLKGGDGAPVVGA